MDLKEIRQTAGEWQPIDGFVELIKIMVVAGLIPTIITTVLGLIPIVQLAAPLVGTLITLYTGFAMSAAYLAAADYYSLDSSIFFGKLAEFDKVLTIISIHFHTFLAGILGYIVLGGCAVLGIVLSTVVNNIIIGVLFIVIFSFVGLILGAIILNKYAMAIYILIDTQGIKGRQAVRASKELMRGHEIELLKLQVSYIPLIIVCSLLFMLPVFFVALPRMSVATAAFYRQLKPAE